MLIWHELERDNPNNIRTKLAQHVQVAHKMTALSSDWSDPYASSNAEYNILRRKLFVRGDTEHALSIGINCLAQHLFIFFSPPPHGVMFSHLREGLCSSKATSAAREPTPRPCTTVGEPIPRTGRHWELNPGPPDLQTSALPTELTGRRFIFHICYNHIYLKSG